MPAPTITVSQLDTLLHTLAEDSYYEDVILHGSPDAPVGGVLVTWMASVGALARAGREGLDTVICHEPCVFVPDPSEASLVSDQQLSHWPANRRRLDLIAKHRLAVICCHRTLDAWCVPDVFYRDILGLGQPVLRKGVRGYHFVQVYEVPPTPARDLVTRFKQTLGLTTIRAHLADPERPIRRLGIAWGGVGLYANFYTTAQVLAEGVDMMVGGETDETAAYFFTEAGVDFVELGHQRSEIDGIAQLVPWLQARLTVPVVLHREISPLEFH